MTRKNVEIIKIAFFVGLGSYLGWLNFQGMNQIFPALTQLTPILKIVFGLGGIFILVKLGIRKQQ